MGTNKCFDYSFNYKVLLYFYEKYFTLSFQPIDINLFSEGFLQVSEEITVNIFFIKFHEFNHYGLVVLRWQDWHKILILSKLSVPPLLKGTIWWTRRLSVIPQK